MKTVPVKPPPEQPMRTRYGGLGIVTIWLNFIGLMVIAILGGK